MDVTFQMRQSQTMNADGFLFLKKIRKIVLKNPNEHFKDLSEIFA